MALSPIRPPSEHNDSSPRDDRSRTSAAGDLLLLVEDNGADVFLVEQALEFFQVPLRMQVAEDGELACQYFEKADADPSVACPRVLLLDLNLPKRSGADVLEQVRSSSRCKNIPVVVLTSSDSPEDRQRAASLGANRYFRKPTSYREFLQIGVVLNEVLKQTESAAPH